MSGRWRALTDIPTTGEDYLHSSLYGLGAGPGFTLLGRSLKLAGLFGPLSKNPATEREAAALYEAGKKLERDSVGNTDGVHEAPRGAEGIPADLKVPPADIIPEASPKAPERPSQRVITDTPGGPTEALRASLLDDGAFGEALDALKSLNPSKAQMTRSFKTSPACPLRERTRGTSTGNFSSSPNKNSAPNHGRMSPGKRHQGSAQDLRLRLSLSVPPRKSLRTPWTGPFSG